VARQLQISFIRGVKIMQTRKLWLATTMLRNRVRTSTGEDIGQVEDVIMDPATDRVLYAVLRVDGYPELFIVPWSVFESSRSPDYLVLKTDRRTLERGPSFNPADWPDITDAAWERRISDHYGVRPVAGVESVPARERVVRAERERVGYDREPVVYRRSGISAVGGFLLALILIGLLWMAFLVSTRGWEGARDQLATYFSGAAYAMKEGSQDATLTAKVKTALSLNRNVPATNINVDSEGDVVTLRGEVPNEQARSLAEQIARDTPGVREVHNHLFAMQRIQ
jgi:hypothetical protein